MVISSTGFTDSTVIIESTGLTISAGVPNNTCLLDNASLTDSCECGPPSNRRQEMLNRQYDSQVLQALQVGQQAPEAHVLQKAV